MARRKQQEEKKQDEVLFDVMDSASQAQGFIEKNQKTIFGVIALIVLVIGGILAYIYAYKAPMNKEAMAAMHQAEQQFARDSFALALDNPGGGAKGFLDIIDDFGGTDAANLSNYYAGISYLNLGQFDAAVGYLSDYSPNDRITPAHKFGALGDAYSELGKDSEALAAYKNAASAKPTNGFSTPYYLMRLGNFQEKMGNAADAKAAYERITKEFKGTKEANDAEKYLIRLASK